MNFKKSSLWKAKDGDVATISSSSYSSAITSCMNPIAIVCDESIKKELVVIRCLDHIYYESQTT